MTESKNIIRSQDEVDRRGAEMYKAMKGQYEPRYKGKILVIDVETGEAYMADKVGRALRLAKSQHKDHRCHVVRIGFDSVYTGL